MLNTDQIRKETTSCKNIIHFNNAGCSLMPDIVLKKYIDYLELENSLGGYEAAILKHKEINEVYKSISQLINCSENEVFLCQNSSFGWQLTLLSLQLSPGDEILIDSSEYVSNYFFFLKVQKERNLVIKTIKQSSLGKICLEDLRKNINNKTKLISLVHIPTSLGTLNLAKEVGEIAKEKGILFLLDACQSAGQYPIDVREIQCDILTTSARKFLRGPRGIGFTYINQNLLENLNCPFIDLNGSDWISKDTYQTKTHAKAFETWERNIAAQIAFNESIKYILKQGIMNIWNRIQYISKYLREKLNENNFSIQEFEDSQYSGITTIKVPDPVSTQMELQKLGINTSCSKVIHSRLNLQEDVLRVSPHYFNTQGEIDVLVEKLKKFAL